MSESEHVYRYAAASAVGTGSVALATSGGVALAGPSAHPHFFAGFLTRPEIAAEALRAVAALAATSYATRPPVSLDPVVTSDGERLRFESFSACGGVQARLDLLPEALDGALTDRGTTSVDVNEPLRRFLARVGPLDTLHLRVGADDLTVSGPGERYVERRVRLPARWLRGFAEVQAIMAGFEPRLELPAPVASAFLRTLPRDASGWVVPAGRTWRLTSRPAPGAVHLSGSDRLGVLVPLLRHATRLRAYGHPTPDAAAAASAWEVELPDARLTLALSPDRWRGYSGEGAGLLAFAGDHDAADADAVHALLGFEPRLDPVLLAERAGLDRDRVRAALAHLAASGLVGYDLAEASYFHRELPYAGSAVEAHHPRLAGARALLEAGAVTRDATGADVVSGELRHRVRDRGDGSWACTCRWWTTHRGDRGPCKHVLAVSILDGKDPA